MANAVKHACCAVLTIGLALTAADVAMARTDTLKARNGSDITIANFPSCKQVFKNADSISCYLTDNQFTNPAKAVYDIEVYADSHTSILNIGIFKKPLGVSRRAAEAKLRQLLHLSGAQLCLLNVSVMVPAAVDHVYSGQNLGLNDCQGAVHLPGDLVSNAAIKVLDALRRNLRRSHISYSGFHTEGNATFVTILDHARLPDARVIIRDVAASAGKPRITELPGGRFKIEVQ